MDFVRRYSIIALGILCLGLACVGGIYLFIGHYVSNAEGSSDGLGRPTTQLPNWLGWFVALLGMPPVWAGWFWAAVDLAAGVVVLLLLYGGVNLLGIGVRYTSGS